MKYKTITISGILVGALAFVPKLASAHCPLCTIGAGFLAVFAASIGVSPAVIGVFIGAFALALGLWIARMIKKKIIIYQDALLALVIFLTTVIPIMPFVQQDKSFYIAIMGEYGTLLHNTYMVNLFLAGSIIGAILLFISPHVSSKLSNVRNGQTWPYQGLGITFGLLIVAALIFQFLL